MSGVLVLLPIGNTFRSDLRASVLDFVCFCKKVHGDSFSLVTSEPRARGLLPDNLRDPFPLVIFFSTIANYVLFSPRLPPMQHHHHYVNKLLLLTVRCPSGPGLYAVSHLELLLPDRGYVRSFNGS